VGLTFGPFTQLETISTTGDKEILEVYMEHKVKTIQVLERHKIHTKAKARMNIPLCHMISMPVVRPTLKINVFKMEHAFQMAYREADKVFYISPIN
jgi:hypothetical protein